MGGEGIGRNGWKDFGGNNRIKSGLGRGGGDGNNPNLSALKGARVKPNSAKPKFGINEFQFFNGRPDASHYNLDRGSTLPSNCGRRKDDVVLQDTRLAPMVSQKFLGPGRDTKIFSHQSSEKEPKLEVLFTEYQAWTFGGTSHTDLPITQPDDEDTDIEIQEKKIRPSRKNKSPNTKNRKSLPVPPKPSETSSRHSGLMSDPGDTDHYPQDPQFYDWVLRRILAQKWTEQLSNRLSENPSPPTPSNPTPKILPK